MNSMSMTKVRQGTARVDTGRGERKKVKCENEGWKKSFSIKKLR